MKISRLSVFVQPTIFVGCAIILTFALTAILAPFIAGDPLSFDPLNRLKKPSELFLFGTDQLGRDLYSRVVYGARVSLIVGLSVALIATTIGLVLGIICGYLERVDAIVMRVMDGMMAIPSILLASTHYINEGKLTDRNCSNRNTGDSARSPPRTKRCT